MSGTAHQDFKQERRNWVLKQIDEGKLDGKTLLYYTNQSPNHAEALRDFVQNRSTSTKNDFLNVTLSLSEQRNILQQRLSSLKSLKEKGIKAGDPDLGLKQQSRSFDVDVQSHKQLLEAQGLDSSVIPTGHNLEISDRSTAEFTRQAELSRLKNEVVIKDPIQARREQERKAAAKEQGPAVDPRSGEVSLTSELLLIVQPVLQRIMDNTFKSSTLGKTSGKPKRVVTLDNILNGKVKLSDDPKRFIFEDGS